MTQKRHVMHGRDHLPTGADPIPGLVTGPTGPGAYDAVILGIDNLLAYWRLGENSGTVFADSSGNGNDLELVAAGDPDLVGDPTYDLHPLTYNVAGAVPADDGAVEFHIPGGTTITESYGEWLQRDGVFSYGSGFPLTACGWIKLREFAGTMPWGVAFGTAAVYGAGTNYHGGWAMAATWPDRTLQFMHGDSLILDMGGESLLADTWYFVAGVIDDDTVRLYVNAVEVDSAPNPGASASGVTTFVGWGVRLGGSYSWRPWQGSVDEVAIWQQALTQAEIETVYAAGVTSFATGDVPIFVDGEVVWGQPTIETYVNGA